MHPKWFSKPMVHLAQIVHLSWIKITTISKRTNTRFYVTHVTQVFHRVHPKWFPSSRYVRRKPCIYLESRLAQSPYEPKRGSIWATSPRSTIRCVQNDFLNLWYNWRKLCNYHALKLTLSRNGSKWYSTWPTSPRSSIRCVQNGFWGYGTFGANCVSILHRG
jgi:hypothetical protein